MVYSFAEMCPCFSTFDLDMRTGFVTMTGARTTRRQALRWVGVGFALTCAASTAEPTFALKPGKPSKEKLLRGTREEKTVVQIEEEKARIAEERKLRLDRQRELQIAADRKKAGLDEGNQDETEIESNLRGQYYFPTARKRYLPRVKLAWDSIPDVEEAVRRDQWTTVKRLCEAELTDAVLPMRLYASSLAGGGLNLNARFIEKMYSQATVYESALKKLELAAKRKNLGVALAILEDMRAAMLSYRESGHLQAFDFGIGEIPTDNRVGSGFSNNNSALYARNKTVQDMAAGTSSTEQ